MVEAGGEVGRGVVRDEDDGEDARDVAEDRDRDGRREEDSPSQPRRLREVRIARGKGHQREEGAEPAARIRHVDRERTVRRADHRPLLDNVRAESARHSERGRAREEPEMDGHDVEERRERDAEEEEKRGE